MTNNPSHQPYDSTLKGLFEAGAAGIIPYLLPLARLKGTPLEAERNVELNRTTLITDKVYWTLYNDHHPSPYRIASEARIRLLPSAARL
ncbi:MAG TPA: hypothetical protein VN207_03985 [Ktedonobacteraceae bacterium]|nr:hypothetical protein [Ktedonobacteraceae bacterium]